MDTKEFCKLHISQLNSLWKLRCESLESFGLIILKLLEKCFKFTLWKCTADTICMSFRSAKEWEKKNNLCYAMYHSCRCGDCGLQHAPLNSQLKVSGSNMEGKNGSWEENKHSPVRFKATQQDQGPQLLSGYLLIYQNEKFLPFTPNDYKKSFFFSLTTYNRSDI